MIRALLACTVVALALPATGFAHAALVGAYPDEQARVESEPSQIRLEFDQAVSLTHDSLRVFAADGTAVPVEAQLADGGRTIRADLPSLPRGAYTVRWRELSADGHVGVGAYTFGYGVAAPPTTEAVGASALTWKDDLARWAYFAALALLLGALAVRLLIVGADPPAKLVGRLNLLAAIGVFAVLDAGVLAFVLRGSNVLQAPFAELLYGDLSPLAEGTRYGVAFMITTVGFAAVAALVLLAWSLDRTVLLWPAFALSVAFAAGLSLSGHQATEPNATWATQLADWAHVIAASLWVGGLIVLATCVWRLAPELRARAFLRFSRLAVFLVAVVVLAGTYLSVVRLPDPHDLWQTGYGQTLLVKIGIVLVALAWGGFHHTFVRPRLERGDTPRGVGRSLLGESTVAVAVLLAAALLVNATPPLS